MEWTGLNELREIPQLFRKQGPFETAELFARTAAR